MVIDPQILAVLGPTFERVLAALSDEHAALIVAYHSGPDACTPYAIIRMAHAAGCSEEAMQERYMEAENHYLAAAMGMA